MTGVMECVEGRYNPILFTHTCTICIPSAPNSWAEDHFADGQSSSNSDGMQTCLNPIAFSLPCSRHTPCAGSTSLPLFRDRLHQKCTATPSTSGRTVTCSAAPATVQNYTATAVESKRGIKNNSTELIGDTPMVRAGPSDACKGQQPACPTPCELCLQVYLNKVNERCFARIACKLELMEPCTRYRRLSSISLCLDNQSGITENCFVQCER